MRACKSCYNSAFERVSYCYTRKVPVVPSLFFTGDYISIDTCVNSSVSVWSGKCRYLSELFVLFLILLSFHSLLDFQT